MFTNIGIDLFEIDAYIFFYYIYNNIVKIKYFMLDIVETNFL